MNDLAVIDLGSNTFHLLIVTVHDDFTFSTKYRKREFVGLSEGGVERIKEEKLQFGLQVMEEFKKHLIQYGKPKLRVLGTAVLRKASNASIFIQAAEDILDEKIEIIDGLREADYIYRGIILTPSMRKGSHLIMDVGGGSTEFIITMDGVKKWSASYPLGVGVLYQLFNHSEPIQRNEIEAIRHYLQEVTLDLKAKLDETKMEYLTGASGSFEVLETMSRSENLSKEIQEISMDDFDNIYEKIISSDYEQRLLLKGLPSERTKLIVVGMVLKKYIIDIAKPKSILVSPFALKEGVLDEMIKHLK